MVTRKQYTKELKLDAINLVLDQGYTITEAVRSLEINAKVIHQPEYRMRKFLQADYLAANN